MRVGSIRRLSLKVYGTSGVSDRLSRPGRLTSESCLVHLWIIFCAQKVPGTMCFYRFPELCHFTSIFRQFSQHSTKEKPQNRRIYAQQSTFQDRFPLWEKFFVTYGTESPLKIDRPLMSDTFHKRVYFVQSRLPLFHPLPVLDGPSFPRAARLPISAIIPPFSSRVKIPIKKSFGDASNSAFPVAKSVPATRSKYAPSGPASDF